MTLESNPVGDGTTTGSGNNDDELAIEILSNIQQFLKGTWSTIKPHQLSIKKIAGGYCNTVYCVQCPPGVPGEVAESLTQIPSRLLYRQYGGTKLGNFIRQKHAHALTNETQETLIFYEAGRTGRAPLIHGVFPGGRIEEFIDGHTMTPEELSDPNILRHTAQAFAAFHALRLPLPDSSFFLTQKLAEMTAPGVIDQTRGELMNSHPHLNLDFLDVDMNEPREWLVPILQQVKSPIVLTHYDNNLLNVMVRDNPMLGQKKVLLIDYEMSKYMPRIYDLGSILVNKTLVWNGQLSKMSGSAYPTLEERTVFLQAYADEIGKHDRYPEVEEAEMNGLEHLMLEADVGALTMCLFMGSGMQRAASQLIRVEESFLTMIPHLHSLFVSLRREFENKYPQFK